MTSSSRSTFLGATLAAGVLAAADVPARALAQAPPARRIDVHHHLLPPPYVAELGDALRRQAPDFAFVLEQWSPARSIEAMDSVGIRTALVSLSTPGVFHGDAAAARRLARTCNEYAAGMAREHPGRFGSWATLPMPDIEGSLAEVAYALDVLKADGVGLLSDYGDRWLGDPSFAPLFDELQRRKAIVFVHPSVANCCRTLVPGVPPAVVEFGFDTTRTIVSLLFAGTFTRCPDVRFIFPQDGGTLPMLADRIARSVKPDVAAPSPRAPLDELKRLYFDVTTSTSAPALAALLSFVPARQVMFGTDFPFLPVAFTANGLDRAAISADQLETINRRTASALLPRYA